MASQRQAFFIIIFPLDSSSRSSFTLVVSQFLLPLCGRWPGGPQRRVPGCFLAYNPDTARLNELISPMKPLYLFMRNYLRSTTHEEKKIHFMTWNYHIVIAVFSSVGFLL
jgi:hypothetical protein